MIVHEVVGDIRCYLSLRSNGEAGRRLTLAAFNEETIIERLAPYLWRDFVRGDYYWPGQHKPEPIDELLPDEWTKSKRLPIRFQQDETKRLQYFAFALGSDLANTAAALLRLAIDSNKVIQRAAPGYQFRSEYSLRKGVFS